MGFFGSLFGGSNNNLSGDINQTSGISSWGQSIGQGDVNAASGFWNTLLSGNEGAQAKLLAPEIGTIQKQGQQQLKTAAQFGNRSGGTNASAQNNIDSQRGQITNMISNLTSGAASNLSSTGQNALNTALSANQLNMEESQQQMENWRKSIAGSGLIDFAQTGLNAAEGGLGL